jgi:hypothetical protein
MDESSNNYFHISYAKSHADLYQFQSSNRLNVSVDITLRQRRIVEHSSTFVRDPAAKVKALGITVPYAPTLPIRPSPKVGSTLGIRLIASGGRTIEHNQRGNLSYADIERLRDPLTAKPKRRQRVSSADAQMGIVECITEDECRSLVKHGVNRLNRAIFRSAGRRRHNRQRLNALICLHNKGTRFHLHMLFGGLPSHITLDQFESLFDDAFSKERFVYEEREFRNIDTVKGAVIYSVNPRKSQSGDPIIYQSWQGITEDNNEHDDEEERDDFSAAIA